MCSELSKYITNLVICLNISANNDGCVCAVNHKLEYYKPQNTSSTYHTYARATHALILMRFTVLLLVWCK